MQDRAGQRRTESSQTGQDSAGEYMTLKVMTGPFKTENVCRAGQGKPSTLYGVLKVKEIVGSIAVY